MSSILEYLAALRQFEHTPGKIGTATIGKTVYAVGSFTQAGGGEDRLVLMPCYRTDRRSFERDENLPLLPASYRRSQRIVYVSAGQCWYVSGWSDAQGVFWLNKAPDFLVEEATRRMDLNLRFDESFEAAMALAGPEVLARIEARKGMPLKPRAWHAWHQGYFRTVKAAVREARGFLKDPDRPADVNKLWVVHSDVTGSDKHGKFRLVNCGTRGPSAEDGWRGFYGPYMPLNIDTKCQELGIVIPADS